jgi:hypothetical protein
MAGFTKPTQLVAINDFLIDCALKETHSFDSQVTEYPVESGSNITDNIRPLPITIEMECIVSNTPIGIMQTFRNSLLQEDLSASELAPTKPSEDAYDMLLRIRAKREPITIRTSLRTYENMALKTLNIPRAADVGDALRFSATFQQIISVENKRSIRVSPPNGRNKKKVSMTPPTLDVRMIRIDTYYHEWFDPDFNVWRRSAQKNTGTAAFSVPLTTMDAVKPWVLYRGRQSPFGDNPQDSITGASSSFIGSIPTSAKTLHRRNIILVPIYQCELKGFFIFGVSSGSTSTFSGSSMWNQGLTALRGNK